jgi:hypothetical protein
MIQAEQQRANTKGQDDRYSQVIPREPEWLWRRDNLDPCHDLRGDITRDGPDRIRCKRVLKDAILFFRTQKLVHDGSS